MADKEYKIKITADGKGLEGSLYSIKQQVAELKRQLTTGLDAKGTILDDRKIAEIKSQLGSLVPQMRNMTKEMNSIGKETKMSTFQLLEFGENLTVVTAGIMAAIGKIADFTKKIYEMAVSGAQLQNMENYFEEISGGSEKANLNIKLLSSAVADTFDTRQILDFANKMIALGYSIEETAKIMDISETASDNLGISIESANDALLKFIETGRGRGLYQFGISVSDVAKRMQELSGLTEEQIKDLDSETQQRLRSIVVIDMYGRSIDDIKNKQKDNADKLESVIVALRKFWEVIQQLLAGSIVPLIMLIEKLAQAFGLVTVNTQQTNQQMLESQKVTKATKYFMDELGLSANNMAEAYTKIEDAIWGMDKAQLETTKRFVLFEKAKIEALIAEAKQFEWNRLSQIQDISTQTIEERSKMFSESIARQTGWEANLNKVNEILGKINSKEEFLNLSEKKRSEYTSKGINDSEVEKQIWEDEIELLQKKLDGTKNEIGLREQLNVLLKKYSADSEIVLNKQKEIYEVEQKMLLLRRSNLDILKILQSKDFTKTGVVEEEPIPERKGYTDILSFEEAMKRFWKKYFEKKEKTIAEKMEDIAEGILNTASQFVSILGLGADTFISKLLNGMKTAIDFANSIVNLLASLGANMGSGGIFGFIGSLLFGGGSKGGKMAVAMAGGGNISGGSPYIVGERGAELFIPNQSGYIMNNQKLMNMMNTNPNINNNNIYIASNIDGLTFLKINYPKYKNYKFSKKI
jgi:DNA-binding transcriptional MerR regulator